MSRSAFIRIIFLFMSLVCGNAIKMHAQAPSFQWAGGLGGTGVEEAITVVSDVNGNVYSCGVFWGVADLDPGSAVFNLTSLGANDTYISKLDANGNFVWAKQIGGPFTQVCRTIKIDAAGNLYLAGFYSGLTDLDPGPGSFTVTTISQTNAGAFLLKLDVNGNFLWAKQIGNPTGGSVQASDFDLDASGEMYLTGSFSDIHDFDPGPGVFTLTAVSISWNGFILKLDANGNFLWVQAIPGWGSSCAIDLSGNIYISGAFIFANDFDPGPGVFMLTPTYINTGGSAGDGFILKLNSSGGFIWVKQLSGTGRSQVEHIELDCQDHLYATGFFEDTFDADPGTGITLLTESVLFHASFLVKLSTAGIFDWGYELDNISSVALDRLGDVYLTGYFSHVTDFDPGPATFTLSPVSTDIFISKYSSSGNFLWATGTGSTSPSGGVVINIDSLDNIYLSGWFAGTVDFDPSPAVHNVKARFGPQDVFVLKLSQTLAPINSTNVNGLAMCASGIATLNATGSTNLYWYTSPTSTLSVGNGSTFITPLLNTSTTYYADRFSCTIGPRLAVTVTVHPLPVISAQSTKSIICTGESATLTATGAAGYTWNTAAVNTLVISPTVTTSYTVTGTDLNGCKGTTILSVPYSSYIPKTNFKYAPVCGNSVAIANPLLDQDFDKGGTFLSSALNLNASNGSIDLSFVKPGTYGITYTVLANGCAGNRSDSLKVMGPDLSLSTGTTLSMGSSITLTVAGGNLYNWTPSGSLSCASCSETIAKPFENTEYCVSSELDGCEAKTCITIFVTCETANDFSVPNAFTPNGDGRNDKFCLQGWNACVLDFLVVIYNRWGEKVFESGNPDFCWDGIYKGNLLSSDVFVYSINATFRSHSKISRKGNITLIR